VNESISYFDHWFSVSQLWTLHTEVAELFMLKCSNSFGVVKQMRKSVSKLAISTLYNIVIILMLFN